MLSSVKRSASLEAHAAAKGKNLSELNSCINLASVECLNEDPKHSLRSMIVNNYNDPSRYLCSLDDEQLLIKIGFNQKISLKEIVIKCAENVVEEKSYPTKIKIYKNESSMDFADAESETPLQEILLTEEDATNGSRIKIRQSRFQNISSVVLFVEENAGFEKTKIHHIGLFGSIPDSTNISEWKPKTGEESMVYY